MNYRTSIKLKSRQKQAWKKPVLVVSIAVIVTCFSVVMLHLKNPETALASGCESSYLLDWSNPLTYTVTCGTVNSANWTVKGDTCFYYSPIFEVGGNVGDLPKVADISVRINQSGNLDYNDTAWVYIYGNDELLNSFQRPGDSASNVFSVSLSAFVPAGGTYRIVIKVMNDKSNETWQVKNGDVTSCLRSINPLPVTLVNFKAVAETYNNIILKWTTVSEKNNDFFTLEHSKAGHTFKEVSRINGAGNSNSPVQYQHIHQGLSTGIHFYRLKQTDYDGTSTYSSVIKANVLQSNKTTKNISLFPNPFTEHFTVEFEAELNQNISVNLVSMDGKILTSQKHLAESGTNSVVIVPPPHIPKGNYLIQVRSNDIILGSGKIIYK